MFTHRLAPSRLAAGLVAACALLSAACNSDSKGASALSGPAASSPTLSFSKTTNGSPTPPQGASNFTVLANAAVTCTDGTITGNVGTFLATPTGSITLTTCPITGTSHVGDGAAIQAYNAFLAAYTALTPKAGDVCTVLTGTLAGITLAPGSYCFTAAATLTGVLTLNGPANGTWAFKIGTGGTGALTGTSFSVVMAGGAQGCNVTWWVSQAATMTDSHLIGTILSGAAITLTRGTLDGNAWAKADVTITGTAVSGCAAGSAGNGGNDCNKDGNDGHGDKDHHKDHHDKNHHDKDRYGKEYNHSSKYDDRGGHGDQGRRGY